MFRYALLLCLFLTWVGCQFSYTVDSKVKDEHPDIVIDGLTLEWKEDHYYFAGTDVKAMFLELGEDRWLATTTKFIDGAEWFYNPHEECWVMYSPPTNEDAGEIIGEQRLGFPLE